MSFSYSSRISSISYFKSAIRSSPTPNANPPYTSGSMPHISSTCGRIRFGVGHPFYQMAHQRLGHRGVHAVHRHLVAVVSRHCKNRCRIDGIVRFLQGVSRFDSKSKEATSMNCSHDSLKGPKSNQQELLEKKGTYAALYSPANLQIHIFRPEVSQVLLPYVDHSIFPAP